MHLATKSNPSQQNVNKKYSANKIKFFHSGVTHSHKTFKYINAKCHSCAKIGHISPVCKSKAQKFFLPKLFLVMWVVILQLYDIYFPLNQFIKCFISI